MIYDSAYGFKPYKYKGLGVFDEDKTCDIFPPEFDESNYVTFFFDSKNGNDASDGLSETAPKRTLAEAERLLVNMPNQGVKIALKGGLVFDGGLTIDRKTEAAPPVTVCGYGGRPVITGVGKNRAVLSINCSNVRVSGLEITDKTAYRGIFIQPLACGGLKNITVQDCYVHDVNFDWYLPGTARETNPDSVDLERVCSDVIPSGEVYSRYNRRSHGGIIFLNDTDTDVGASWFENVFILDNKVENVARTGIYVANVWADKGGVGYGKNKYVSEDEMQNRPQEGIGYFKSKNVVCSGNVILCAGGDGMILSSVKHVFSEYNVCYYANYLGRTNYWNAGLWVFDAENAWIRHNEAAYTYMRHNSNDAQGFDLDNACVKVVFKHNYAHHNEGGGLLVCNNKTAVIEHDADGNPLYVADGQLVKSVIMGRWYDNLVSGNLFVENGNPHDQTRSAFITIARECDWLFACKNIVVLRPCGDKQSIIHTEDKSQKCRNHYYINNIFYCEKKTDAVFSTDMLEKAVFSGNVFYNVGESSGFLSLDRDLKTELPPFFDRETLYGFSTRKEIFSGSINWEQFISKNL